MAEGGDFASLIGSQALIAKQLDLWWRYELLPESSMHIDGDSGDGGSSEFPPPTPEERLTRKTYHTLPFLMRNISNCPFQPRKRKKGPCSRPSVVNRSDSSDVDVIAQCFGIGSPNRAKRKRNQEGNSRAVGFIDSIKQKITGWFSPPDKSPPQTPAPPAKHKKTSEQKAPSTINSNRLQVDALQSGPLGAYELFSQSSQVRQMVLDGIDPSLHHDEDLIKNRIDALWQEITAEESGNNDGSNNNSCMGIDKYAYWLDMEEKDRAKFKDKQYYSRTHNKRRKINNDMESIRVPNSLSSSWCKGTFSPVFFHYMYVNEKNHPSTVVEKRLDRKCPFCSYQGKCDEDLLGHCGIWHGVLTDYYQWRGLECGLSFQAVLDEDRHLHFVVKSLSCSLNNELDAIDEFTFVQTKCTSKINSSIPFLLRSPKNIAAMDPAIRKQRLLTLQSNDAPAYVISRYLPTDKAPIRQYFHSRTNLPLEDWNDIDSDDEPDDEWLHKMSSDLIGEFEDITSLEKNFMRMWNRFIKRHVVIADREIPAKCQEFIHTHIQDLKDGGMRNNLLLHLMNLWDSGVISSNRILACMQQYDKGGADLSRFKRDNADLA